MVDRVQMGGKVPFSNTLLIALCAVGFSIIGLPEPGFSRYDQADYKISEPALKEISTLIESGAYKNARERLHLLMAQDPKDVQVRILAGRLYRKMGLWSLSLVEYEHARSLDPKIVEPYVALSEMHLENLSVEIALAMAREAIRLAPDSVRAHEVLISALIANHNMRDAESELHRLRQLFPDDPDVLYLAYKINRQMGDLVRARSDLQEAMMRKQDNSAWLLDLADVCEANGDYLEARAALDKYLLLAPDSVVALGKEAELLEFRLYDLDGAKKTYSRMLEIEPDNQAALAGNERIFRKRNDIAAAIKRFIYKTLAAIASLFWQGRA